jgi:hypothetical protein
LARASGNEIHELRALHENSKLFHFPFTFEFAFCLIAMTRVEQASSSDSNQLSVVVTMTNVELLTSQNAFAIWKIMFIIYEQVESLYYPRKRARTERVKWKRKKSIFKFSFKASRSSSARQIRPLVHIPHANIEREKHFIYRECLVVSHS